jgi:hypothetical protein
MKLRDYGPQTTDRSTETCGGGFSVNAHDDLAIEMRW